MLKIGVNNERVLEINQLEKWVIEVATKEKDKTKDKFNISEGDFAMLLNYYKFIKDNDIQCDFINPYGKKEMRR